MYLPKNIGSLIGGQSLRREDIGMSGARVYFFGSNVLKIEERNRESDNNLAMLAWLEGKLEVPRVLAEESEGDIRYLVMSRLPGEMACSGQWLDRPKELVRRLARGLEQWWSVAAGECPCSQMLERKLINARYQVEHGLVDMDNVEPETFGEGGFDSPAGLLAWLEANRPEEVCVLSHGDFCLPNVFLRESCCGFLDLGRSGLADKWVDLSICWRSLRDNFNGTHGYRDPSFDPDWLFDELGIRPDREKMRYYLLMDELF